MRIEQEGCDVFDVKDWPRVALDDVLSTEITIKVGGDIVFSRGVDSDELVLCVKARERLLNGIERLLKPPAKREKDSPDV